MCGPTASRCYTGRLVLKPAAYGDHAAKGEHVRRGPGGLLIRPRSGDASLRARSPSHNVPGRQRRGPGASPRVWRSRSCYAIAPAEGQGAACQGVRTKTRRGGGHGGHSSSRAAAGRPRPECVKGHARTRSRRSPGPPCPGRSGSFAPEPPSERCRVTIGRRPRQGPATRIRWRFRLGPGLAGRHCEKLVYGVKE